MDAIKKTKEGVLIAIEVVPDSKETKIAKYNAWRKSYQLNVCAKAEKGEANKEIIKFFSKMFFGKDISIIGKKSRRKFVIVRDADEEEVRNKFIVK